MDEYHHADVADASDGADELLGAPDVASFWREASSWALRALLLIAVAKVGITLLICLIQGKEIQLRWWFGVVPYFEFGIDQGAFVRLVTMSTWLGIAAMVTAVAWAEYRRRGLRSRPTEVTEVTDESDEPAESGAAGGPVLTDAYVEFVTGARRTGIRFGALFGCLSLPVTILFEFLRDRWHDSYVWPQAHLTALTLALTPVLALVVMWGTGAFGRSASLAVLMDATDHDLAELTSPAETTAR